MKYSVIAVNVTAGVDDYGTALGTFSNRKDAEIRLEGALKTFASNWGLTGPINRQKEYVSVTGIDGAKFMFLIEETKTIL